jgi:hypothetical protein
MSIKVICILDNVEYAQIKESRIHEELKEYNHWGEWFKCDLQLVENAINKVFEKFISPMEFLENRNSIKLKILEINNIKLKTNKINKINKTNKIITLKYHKNEICNTSNGTFYFTGEYRVPKHNELFLWCDKVYKANKDYYSNRSYIVTLEENQELMILKEPITNEPITIVKFLKE